tara:strand:+ start:23 stop:313 length:291 start_codon:yes stop_codon:yes gene_type:complete
MSDIKPISHFIMVLCMINIVLQVLLHKEISKEKPIPTISVPALDQLIEDSKSRESMIMQVLLLGQHKSGLHEGIIIDLCPMCSDSSKKAELKITEL